MRKFHNLLARDPRAAWAVSLSLLAAIGYCDYATGIEYGFGLFYLVPVALITWHIGRKPGLLMSVLAATGWALADYLPRLLLGLGPVRLHITIWNTAIGLGIYAAFALALAKLKKALEHEREILRLKSDLLAVVSHECNNSLTSMGMALLLLRQTDEDPEQRRKIYPVLGRVHRVLKTTVRNFLNQARMQTGRFQLDLRQTELRRLVAEALEFMRPLSDQKDIDLRLEFPETVVPVNADPDALALVMSNLIGNAVKYTPKGGRVTVSLVPKDPGREVEVSVSDTGIGIDAKDQQAIFGGFRTLESRKAAKGYGVGLTITRDILEAHGSPLRVESSLGAGSRFFFKLPICPLECPHRGAGLCHRCRSRNPLSQDEADAAVPSS